LLPWVQDLDADGDSVGDVWGGWDVTLRDLVFIDRAGNYVERANLTSFNPDVEALGECTGNYETIKQMVIDLY